MLSQQCLKSVIPATIITKTIVAGQQSEIVVFDFTYDLAEASDRYFLQPKLSLDSPTAPRREAFT